MIIMHAFESRWRHQMEPFSALVALCAENSPVPVNSPHKGQRRGALMFSFDLHLNKRLSKQPWGWWFETPSLSLWRHCNVLCPLQWRHVSASRRHISQATRLFVQQLFPSEHGTTGLLWGESPGHRWLPGNGSVIRRVFQYYATVPHGGFVYIHRMCTTTRRSIVSKDFIDT